MIAVGLNEVDLSTIPKNTKKILLHDYPDQFAEIQGVLTRRQEPAPVIQNSATWIAAPTWSFGEFGISNCFSRAIPTLPGT